jgi:pseudaminic acid synthase
MKIKISRNLTFNSEGPPLLIAEISANHSGSKKIFLNHIISAKRNGADLVKIQTYEENDMVVVKNYQIEKGLWKNKNLYKLYSKAKTPYSWHESAFNIAKKNDITLFSTPFSIKALSFLKKFKPSLYKISSFEITDLNLIREIAKTKKPIILSTGLATIKEIRNAINEIRKFHNKIIILHCISGYPTPLKEINLRKIEFLRDKLKIKFIGLSDHTKGIKASQIASVLGISAIEKHFKLNDKIKSPDSSFSINPKQLKKLKDSIKLNNIILGDKNFKIKDSELSSLFFRRSIFATKDIDKNQKITKNNIGCFRPNIGIGAENYFKVIGKKVKKKIKRNNPIKNLDLK